MLVLCKCLIGVAHDIEPEYLWNCQAGPGADRNPRLVNTRYKKPHQEILRQLKDASPWRIHRQAGLVNEVQHLLFLGGEHSMTLLQQLNAEGEPSSIEAVRTLLKDVVFQSKEHFAQPEVWAVAFKCRRQNNAGEGSQHALNQAPIFTYKICTSFCSWWTVSEAPNLLHEWYQEPYVLFLILNICICYNIKKIGKQWVNQIPFCHHLNSTRLWEFKAKKENLRYLVIK